MMHFEGDRWENEHISSKPRHVTPQINCLTKMSPVLRVSTHIYGSFQGDRWENIHFSTKPRHVTPQIDCLRKTSPVLRVSTHIYGISKEIDGKILHFSSKPWHVTPQINHLRKMKLCSGCFQHTFLACLMEIDGKTFIFK